MSVLRLGSYTHLNTTCWDKLFESFGSLDKVLNGLEDFLN